MIMKDSQSVLDQLQSTLYNFKLEGSRELLALGKHIIMTHYFDASLLHDFCLVKLYQMVYNSITRLYLTGTTRDNPH